MQNEEFFDISSQLENYHSIFSKMWEIGLPLETTSIDTLCVGFDKDGNFTNFLYNPEFFNKLNDESKTFAIAHECLHVILNHGNRLRGKKINSELANIAMDIAINERLVRMGWERKNLNVGRIAFVDTVFGDNSNTSKFESSESYYEKLNKTTNNQNLVGSLIKVDENYLNSTKGKINIDSILGDVEDEEIDSLIQSVLPDVNEGSLEDIGIKASTHAGNRVFSFKKRVKKLKKWETIVRKWINKKIKEEEEIQWLFTNRRYQLLPKGFFLPSISRKEKIKEDKLDVIFFLDTSGSCYNYAQRFFDLANSVPKDKFNVHLYCFSTNVYEVNSNKLRGFGGTFFHILENKVQEIKRKQNKYPDAIWVVTDGYGNTIVPEHPEKWTWLLTQYSSEHLIPQKSKIYRLSDFE